MSAKAGGGILGAFISIPIILLSLTTSVGVLCGINSSFQGIVFRESCEQNSNPAGGYIGAPTFCRLLDNPEFCVDVTQQRLNLFISGLVFLGLDVIAAIAFVAFIAFRRS